MDKKGMRAFDVTVIGQDIQLVEVKNVVIHPDDYRQLFDSMMEFSNGRKVWVLTETNAVKMVTRSARHYAYERGPEVLEGAAMVINTDIARMVIAFFMQIGTVPFSMETFKDRAQAMRWIKQCKGEL